MRYFDLFHVCVFFKINFPYFLLKYFEPPSFQLIHISTETETENRELKTSTTTKTKKVTKMPMAIYENYIHI